MRRVIGRIERTLHTSAQRLKQRQRAQPTALWVYDPGEDPALRATAEGDPEKAAPADLLLDPEYVLGALGPPERERLLRIVHGEAKSRGQAVFRVDARDGAVHWLQLRGFGVVRQDDARITIVQDVTEGQAWDEQVSALHDELRSLVLEVVLAEEHERRQLAQDLHDGIGQSLFLIRIRLDAFTRTKDARAADQTLAGLRDLIRDAQRLVQTTTFALSPPVLHDLGLVAAIEWLADDVTENHGLPVRCAVTGANTPPDKRADILLYRAARELLLNTVKHAGAGSAEVLLACGDDELEIVVCDDGKGFDPALLDSTAGCGFGLFSMRERLAHLGGVLDIVSSPDRGTRVRIAIPRRVPPVRRGASS